MTEKAPEISFDNIVITPDERYHAAVITPQLAQKRLSGKVSARVERRASSNRRASFWHSLMYGNFRPRRRASRREADAHHYLFDWHEPRVLYLALAILLLSCIDALFTLNLLNAGATEANVIMATLLEHSVDKFLAVKIIMTAVSIVIMVFAARRKFIGVLSVEHLLHIFCFAYFMVICYEIYLFRFVFDLQLIPEF